MGAEEKYFNNLKNLAGQAGSRNARLLGIASLGILAGRNPELIAREIIEASGVPPLRDDEVWRAVHRAEADTEAGKPANGARPVYRKPRPPDWVRKVSGFVPLMLRKGAGCESFEALRAMSPQALPPAYDSKGQARAFLSRLFGAGDFIYFGEAKGTEGDGGEVAGLAGALAYLDANSPAPFICANPLTGEWGETSTGAQSRRAQSCVACPRYAVLEFDAMPLPNQARFFAGVVRTRALRLRSVVYSGSKSLHGIIETGLQSSEGFPAFKRALDAMLAPPSLPDELKADRACWNLNRLTRCAGAWRADKGRAQELLWLA